MMRRINAFQTNLQQNIDQLQALARQERQTGKKDLKEFKNVFASFRNVVSDKKRLNSMDPNTKSCIIRIL